MTPISHCVAGIQQHGAGVGVHLALTRLPTSSHSAPLPDRVARRPAASRHRYARLQHPQQRRHRPARPRDSGDPGADPGDLRHGADPRGAAAAAASGRHRAPGHGACPAADENHRRKRRGDRRHGGSTNRTTQVEGADNIRKSNRSNIVIRAYLTLAHVGGGCNPPEFFLATCRTVSDSLLKFSVPSWASFAQLLVFFFVKVMSGHGAMAS